MRQGQTTLAYVIAAVLILAFAGTALFALSPRLQRAPGIVETLLPEKCITTGLTREQYLVSINDAMMELPKPRSQEAINFFKEMKACFPDAEAPQGLIATAKKGIDADLNKLIDTVTVTGFNEVLKIYDTTKGVIAPDDWTAAELLLFARAMATDPGRDPLPLLEAAMQKVDTDAQKAEARAMSGYWLAQYAKKEEAKRELAEQIMLFDKNTNPDILFFVGLAKEILDKLEEKKERRQDVIAAFKNAAENSKSDYITQAANYHLGITLLQIAGEDAKSNDSQATNMYRDAAAAFEKNIRASRSSYFRIEALTGLNYPKIPQSYRAIPNCTTDAKATKECICIWQPGPALLEGLARYDTLPGSPLGDYCCKESVSKLPCVCRRVLGCEDYKTKEECYSDPCVFSGRDERWREYGCAWGASSCYMESSTTYG